MRKLYFIIPIIFILIIILLNIDVSFSLNGEDYYIVNYGEEYIENGFSTNVFNSSLNNLVEVTTNLDVSTLGEYNINYNLRYLNKNYSLNRKVVVVDNNKPMIRLNGDSYISLNINDSYVEYGAVAIDDYDKDITDKIIISSNLDISNEGIYTINYSVSDSSGNKSETYRIVKVSSYPVYSDYDIGYNDLSNDIVKYINDKGYDVSIGYYNLTNGKTFYYKENKLYYGASLIKALLSIYMYENDLVNDSNKVDMEKMVSVSNNDSYFNLLYQVGINNLKDYGNKLGTKYTLVGPDNFGMTNVIDQIIVFKKLYSMVRDNKYAEMKSYFINDYFNGLKINDNVVLHKYGYWDSIYHDCGIFLEEEPYILVVLTNNGFNDYLNIVNDISNLMYKYHINSL